MGLVSEESPSSLADSLPHDLLAQERRAEPRALFGVLEEEVQEVEKPHQVSSR